MFHELDINVSRMVYECFMNEIWMFHEWKMNVSWMKYICFMNEIWMFHEWNMHVSWIKCKCIMNSSEYSEIHIPNPNNRRMWVSQLLIMVVNTPW